MHLITYSTAHLCGVKLMWLNGIALGYHLLQSQTADSNTGGRSLTLLGNIVLASAFHVSFMTCSLGLVVFHMGLMAGHLAEDICPCNELPCTQV